MPEVNSFGVLGVFLTVIPGMTTFKNYASCSLLSFLYFSGLLVGAFISKNIASFLEENDLFIPDDEDDD